MFPRERRVSKSLFPEILKNSRPYHSPNLTIRLATRSKEDDKQKPTQFSVIVSGQVSKKAVIRNLWKRRTRNITMRHLDQIRSGYYCLIFLKPSVTKLSFKSLEEELMSLFYKTKLI